MFNEEQKQEILDAALEHAKEQIIESAISDIAYSVQIAVKSTVQDIVKEWAKENLAPAIRERLSSQKGELVEAAIISAGNMAELLARALTETLAEKLTSPYKARDIFKTLFE